MKKILITILFLIFSNLSLAQNKEINLEKSKVKWYGKEITTKVHYGTLKFKKGILKFEDEILVSGEFIVDMESLTVDDLTGRSKKYLEDHLRSDSFFSVEKFKESSLKITSSSLLKDSTFEAQGVLSIKGISNNIKFTMIIKDSAESKLTFDRTKFDVKYRSGNFFQNLGDKLIYDDIDLEVSLVLN